tara:strand:- start:274 stop:1650 length:1377 start_codon:yes stop_codon:yes gene_type:complete
MDEIIQKNPGPFSNLILKNNNNNVLRSDKSKKKNRNNKEMTTQDPSIKLVDSNSNINVKASSSINNIDLIKDSDDDSSIATAEPRDNLSIQSTPVKTTKTSKKQSVPVANPDEFKFFSNTKKQKPVVEKEPSEYSSDEEESEAESESDTKSVTSELSYKHEKKKLNSKDIEKKKQDLLIKLLALEKKGVTLTKNYSLKSSLDEIEFEYNTQKKAMEIEASVHFQQKILMAAVTGIEFLNKKFDPINAKLDGWSESVMDNIIDYEEIFKKLHEKYSEKTSMPPELQLLVTLVGSGFMFHLTNSLFKSSLPGLGDVLKTNPDIMSNIMGAMGKAMNNSQGITPPPPQQTQQQPASSASSNFTMPNMPAINNLNNVQVNKKEFTSPSINLSNMMNTFNNPLPKPIVQQAPKQKYNDDQTDQISVISSSDYSDIDESIKTVDMPSITKGKGNKIKKGKSIKI